MRGSGSAGKLWLLLLSFGIGCGSGQASDPTFLSEPSWGAAYAAAVCARIFGCCDPAEQIAWSYTDQAQCRQKVAMEAQTSLDGVFSIGWVSYDGKAARRCVDDIASLACTDLVIVGKGLIAPSCAGITRGTGKIGASCEDLDVICESSNCIGTCGPTRGCSVVCGANEYCDTATQACATLKADGASCAGNGDCVFPLSCQPPGVCAAPRPGGASCASMSDCASASCVDGLCAAQMCDGV
jgi:hypothetical protein